MSAFELREVDRGKIYLSIVDQVVEGIRSGAFHPGTALPPERTLALRLGVSRASVREAVRVLEHAGVLDVRTGSGTYVTEQALSKTTLLRVEAAAAGQHSPLDIMVVRRALEPVCAELAAQQHTTHDIALLRSTITAQAKELECGRDPSEPDRQFHLFLGSATHNILLYSMIKRVVEVMHQQLWHNVKLQSLGERGRATHFLQQHESILCRLEAGDGVAAAREMSEHLDAVEAGLMEHLG
jgi:GntR family transcriptional regulator, transcriptional repressor for pyruvate dehydrogenase complex